MPAGERRRLMVLGGILGLLLAVFAAKTFLVSDTNTTTRSTATSASKPFRTPKKRHAVSPRKGAAAAATPTTAAPVNQAPPDTFQVYATKNPFEPVIQVEAPTTAPSGGSATTAPPAGATTTTIPSNQPPAGQSVVLIDIYHDSNGVEKAHVQVGSTVYVVAEGQTFANGAYRVVSLDDPCGQFLYGDSPFRLCVGEQTIK
jgi:hypothetical protein